MDHSQTRQAPRQTPDVGDLIVLDSSTGGQYAATVKELADAAVLGQCVGNAVAFTKTSSGTNQVLAAASVPRFLVILVNTTEAIADAGGTASVFTIGEQGGSATKFAAAAALGAALNDVRVFTGTLSANAKLEVYATAALTSGTGGIKVSVIAVRASS